MTRIDKQKALKLRLQGKTYTDIQKELGEVSKATLSVWLKDVILSEGAKNMLALRTREKSFAGMLKRNKRQTSDALERRRAIMHSSSMEVGMLSDRELMILGGALYWAEGYKRPLKRNGKELIAHYVSFTNSDVAMAKVFLKCMTQICGVEISKIKVEARIFKHHNADEVVGYWSGELGIPKENFVKTYAGISSASAGKRPYNRLPYGVIQIRINNTNLFYRIMGWIEGLKTSI